MAALLRLQPSLTSLLLTTFVWANTYGAPASVAEAELPADVAALLATPSAWTGTASLQTGFGYKDNIFLSHTGAESSTLARAGIEALMWHLPRGRVDYFAFVNAEETRYFTSPDVDHEAQVFAQGEWRYRIGDVFKFTLDGQGYYLDQIFDVSDTEVKRDVAELKVAGATIGPTLRWVFWPGWSIEVQGTGRREVYHDGLNNNRAGEGAVRLGWRPGTRFEGSVGGTGRQRDFDRRTQYDSGGRALDGTLLKIAEREGELRCDVTWDAAARWKTTTHAGTLYYRDNGSGYFNYHQRKLEQTLEWTTDKWLVRLEGSARRLEFEEQTVGLGINPPARIKEEFIAQLRVERKISARWTAFAEYDWERSRCNDPIASYLVRQEMLGAKWSWEK